MVSLLSNKRQWTIAGLVILLIVLVGLLPPPNPALAQSTVTLDTTSGPPGTEVTATGSGWSAGHEVKVRWDNTELTATTVDDNGGFTASFTVPENVAEGQYTVYFVDAPPDGGLGYFIPATFTVTAPAETPPPDTEPTISLDPTEGAPGSEVSVQGSGWVAGDTIIIHFAISGNEVAQATVDDDGTFETSFTVPDDAESGEQLVIAGTAEASHQTDAPFQVTEPGEDQGCISRLTVQRVFTQDTGGTEKTTFAPGEPIRFVAEVDNTYGGYLLGTHGAKIFIGTDFYTDTHRVDFPPDISAHIWDATAPSTAGNYTVAVRAFDSFCGMWVGGVGENGRFSVTGQEETPPPEAEPTITLDPTEGPPGTEVTVQGSGWIAGDIIIIHFAISGNEVAKATVDDDGNFETTFTVPEDAEIGDQKVIAGNFEASWQADAVFNVKEEEEEEQPSCPEPTVTLSTSSGRVGDTITVQGEGWISDGAVTLIINGPKQHNMGSVPVPDSGEWESSFTIPDTPPGDYYFIFSEIHECPLHVTELFTIVADQPEAEPTITLDPTEGLPGTEVTVRGSGWIPEDTVIMQFSISRHGDNLEFSEVAQATVADDGSFETTFTAPANAAIGEQKVIAGTAEISQQADADFRVTGEPLVTVEQALTLEPDEPGSVSFHIETIFRPGDKIWYAVVVRNSGPPINIEFTWLAKYDGQDDLYQEIFSDKNTVTVQTGDVSYYSPGTIPSDAAAGTYINRVTVRVGGQEFVRESRFEIVSCVRD